MVEVPMDDGREQGIRSRYEAVAPYADERVRRRLAGAESMAYGRGGVSAVARATGLSRTTVAAGVAELEGRAPEVDPDRVRRRGGGRRPEEDKDDTLLSDLKMLIEPSTMGDPENPLQWVSKSRRTLVTELRALGHGTSTTMVTRLLASLGYSLQANKKTLEGAQHPDRNAQFEHIATRVAEFQSAGNPVVSVDAKKKELVGDFKNAGRELRPKGDPEKVRVHDFVLAAGRSTPYGIYDLTQNEGWVSVGVDHDTAAFAVETLRRWWYEMGVKAYPDAGGLLLTADGGGSNGSRVRLWKLELQKLSTELGFPISVCHLPPGTSKWNKIEHRMFSFISKNWRGKPLVNHATIVSLIGATTTKAGLRIRAAIDRGVYPTGIKVTKREMAELRVLRDDFHPEWNYKLVPTNA